MLPAVTSEPAAPGGAVVIGPSYLDSFASNIADGLREWGYGTTTIDPTTLFRRQLTLRSFAPAGILAREVVRRISPLKAALVDRPVERQLAEADPSLVICVHAELGPSQIERFRQATPGATWVFWYPDALSNLGGHAVLLAPYDHFFFKEPYLVDQLRSRTPLSAHLLAQASNPRHHRTEPAQSDDERRRYECDVAVAGNIYPYRLLVLSGLPHGISLKIYGNPAQRVPPGFEHITSAQSGEYVTGRTKAVAFGCAKIVLNTMHYAEINGINSRLFEATACGGFVLTHTAPGLERYFAPDIEVATYNTRADLHDKVRHYLRADEERHRIALAGQARAALDHTYRNRIGELLAITGLAGARRSEPG